MSDLALRESDPTGGRLVAWASSLTAAGKIGEALCATSFVPQHFRNKPQEAAAAILFGDEIGLTPTQSLQSVYVISGKPALYARAMVAIVLAAGHEVVTVKKTDGEVVVKGRRRGSQEWITESWTTQRARRAGYTNNKKYESDPQSMLYARAASDVCRQIAPDALAGIGYSVEEMELVEPSKVTVARTANTSTTSTKVRREVAEPEIEAIEAAPTDVVDAEVIEPELHITDEQTRRMGELMKAAGLTTKPEALAYCASVIDRDIASRDDLTEAEAALVIGQLEADTQPAQQDPEEQ